MREAFVAAVLHVESSLKGMLHLELTNAQSKAERGCCWKHVLVQLPVLPFSSAINVDCGYVALVTDTLSYLFFQFLLHAVSADALG